MKTDHTHHPKVPLCPIVTSPPRQPTPDPGQALVFLLPLQPGLCFLEFCSNGLTQDGLSLIHGIPLRFICCHVCQLFTSSNVAAGVSYSQR